MEGEVRRLLSGQAELWELIMTGGLWRVSGKEIRDAAEGAPCSSSISISLASMRAFKQPIMHQYQLSIAGSPSDVIPSHVRMRNIVRNQLSAHSQ